MIGMVCAHAGIAVFVAGVFITESTSIERDVAARPGQVFELRGYDFAFDGVEKTQGPNYLADRGTVRVSRDGVEVAVLHPEKRAYLAGGQVMTEAALDGGFTRDLYVALGEPLDTNGTWALRLYVKPYIRLIWLGSLFMALGGFIVAFDKRFRRKVPA
jgi:cytochrome c-type biogenesis protein CcmF